MTETIEHPTAEDMANKYLRERDYWKEQHDFLVKSLDMLLGTASGPELATRIALVNKLGGEVRISLNDLHDIHGLVLHADHDIDHGAMVLRVVNA